MELVLAVLQLAVLAEAAKVVGPELQEELKYIHNQEWLLSCFLY